MLVYLNYVEIEHKNYVNSFDAMGDLCKQIGGAWSVYVN